MNKLYNVEHVGYVVHDIDKYMKIFNDFFGLKDWKVRTMKPPMLYELTCYGEEVSHSFKIAMASLDGFTIELIMPIEGENVYSDFLKERGEGLHHICLTFATEEELELTKEKYMNMGGKVIQGGKVKKPKGNGLYYYIEKGGIILELKLGNSNDKN